MKDNRYEPGDIVPVIIGICMRSMVGDRISVNEVREVLGFGAAFTIRNPMTPALDITCRLGWLKKTNGWVRATDPVAHARKVTVYEVLRTVEPPMSDSAA